MSQISHPTQPSVPLSLAKQKLLQSWLQGKSGASIQQIPPRGTQQVIPLSFAQQRLWFLELLATDKLLAYNSMLARRFKGTLNVSALEQGLIEIVRRHEILRTTFQVVNGEPRQIIASHPTLDFSVIDLSDVSESQREALVQNLTTAELSCPFNLATGPLLRARLFRLTKDEHIFLLPIHHIICDVWSSRPLLQELRLFYRAFCEGRAPQLPDLPIQYADFSIWQRQQLQGETLQTLLTYWKQTLEGAPFKLDLPADRARPAIQTDHGSVHFFQFSAALADALKTLSQQENCTLFMTLLAAFEILLYRYTGMEDIVVGFPVANRTRVELENLIGFFVNTLVLRTRLDGNPTFLDLLRRVRQVAIGAYAHQDLPFEKLVEELRPDRLLSHSPLFQIMFVLQNTPRASADWPGLTETPVEVITPAAKFDWTVELTEHQDGLAGLINYNSDLFEADTIRRVVSHFQTLLEGIVAAPGQRIGELPLLSAAEQHHLVVDCNNTTANYPHDLTIQQLFEERVERLPEAVAFIYNDQHLTYRALNQRANQIAHHLRRRGVGPEARVGLCITRSLEMVVGLLGILKSGGAYVPLDPYYPQERLAFMLHDAHIDVLLTLTSLNDLLPAHSAQVICVDGDWESTLASYSQDNPVNLTNADNPAFVIYTSGSTGKPKGVLGLHRGALNRFNWMWKTFPFEAETVCCQKTSLSFVDSVWETLGPLLQGMRTVIFPNEVVQAPDQLIADMAAAQVTRIVVVPSLLRTLLDTRPNLQERLPHLRYCVTSGEALPVDLVRRFRETLPQARLINLYGSSEVSADVTWHETGLDSGTASSLIGKPLFNTQIYLLDNQWRLLPTGIPGELYVGGVNLARGYLNRPDLTAERFIPHPFASTPGARLYRTGDLARYFPDGSIEFLGRVDHQVKIRGMRVELDEVQLNLAQHFGVRECLVVAHSGETETSLIAYIVPRTAGTLTVNELRRFLQTRLPEYMQVNTYVFLDGFPLTPNGKIDRLALPTPDGRRPVLDIPYVQPQTELEGELATIWQQVLGLERVGIHDNFFDLGGHSLLLIQVLYQLREKYKCEVRIVDLFKHTTISQLAQYLGQAQVEQPTFQQSRERARLQRAALNQRAGLAEKKK